MNPDVSNIEIAWSTLGSGRHYAPRQLIRAVMSITGGVVPDVTYSSAEEKEDGSLDWLIVATSGGLLIHVTAQANGSDIEAAVSGLKASASPIASSVSQVSLTSLRPSGRSPFGKPSTSPWLVTAWQIETSLGTLTLPRKTDETEGIEAAETVVLALIEALRVGH